MSKGQRQSKRELRRQQKAQQERMRKIRTWGPVGLIVLFLIVFSVIRIAGRQDVEGVTVAAAEPGGQHDSSLDIPFGGLPPMGGPHNPAWQNCGIYDTPVPPQYAIHSMEHGAIWVTYHPDLPESELAILRDAVRGDEYMLLSPYPDQDSPIVLTVWDRQLVLESAGDERVDQFLTAYRRARGPERAASCNNGVGVPTG